jgi:ribosomal protein S14
MTILDSSGLGLGGFQTTFRANPTSSLYSQALRYIIRNTTLPQRVRAQAQLQLSQMHAYTRPTQIKNRCVAGGIARSVIRDFRIARVSEVLAS